MRSNNGRHRAQVQFTFSFLSLGSRFSYLSLCSPCHFFMFAFLSADLKKRQRTVHLRLYKYREKTRLLHGRDTFPALYGTQDVYNVLVHQINPLLPVLCLFFVEMHHLHMARSWFLWVLLYSSRSLITQSDLSQIQHTHTLTQYELEQPYIPLILTGRGLFTFKSVWV